MWYNSPKGGWKDGLFQKNLVNSICFILYIQLFVNMPDMLFDGVDGIIQFTGNFFIQVSFRDKVCLGY